MKKSIITAVSILLVTAMFCFYGCLHQNDDNSGGSNGNSNSNINDNSEEEKPTIISGIFSEENEFYIYVDAENSPADGNGAW